ncbi:MAG: alpha/beta hydrolase [Balneolaceae bacterium]|nr:alpha/beta hydrolase [Balneolaceae bacterium]
MKTIYIHLINGLIIVSFIKEKSEMRKKIINTNGVELYTESFGDENNSAIMLLAGATVSMLYWDEEFCQKLADNGFFVIRYDNRDTGKSTFYEPGSTPYDIVDLTDDAVAILDEYGIGKANFAGISLGGLISQIAALKYPDRVHSLTLISSGPWGDSDPSIPEMDSRILDFHSKSGSVDWSDEEAVVEYMLEGAALMSGRKQFDERRGEKLIRAEFNRANNYISMFNHAALQGGEKYFNRLNEIKQPALIIHGTDDLIWHFNHTGVLLEKIEDSQLIELEGTGHELHVEDWDVIIEGITVHGKVDPYK